jgi:hypothetical protein
MNININDFTTIGLNHIKESISSERELTISFPIPSIGFSNSRIDIISDLRDVSFCCEKVANYITVIDSSFVTRDKYYTDFQIRCLPTDIDKLFDILVYSSQMLGNEDVDNDVRLKFMDDVSDYEESFNKRLFTFPELINDYWANLINGAYWEIASEYHESEDDFFRDTYKKHPEHRFGFWRSPKTRIFKEPIYFSTDSWIIPPGTDLIEALKNYSGLNFKLEIEDAEKVEYKGQVILLTNNAAVYFKQFEQLQNAINCSQRALKRIFLKDDRHYSSQVQKTSLFGEAYIKRTRIKSRNYRLDHNQLSFKVSEFGDLIVVNCQGFDHVFFGYSNLTFEEIKELNSHLYPAFSKTQNLIANSISQNCNWKELNDDTFEELCYDILYCHPKFDSTTIQKMGKSKSRDGGRDILIKSKKTPTNEQDLYIFQCKFLSESTSLSASKVPNAGNVIMQYGAKGYGVFTTTVIDSTLYDMMDGFKRNLDIDTSNNWSKYELERHLNRHQMIKNKYFR